MLFLLPACCKIDLKLGAQSNSLQTMIKGISNNYSLARFDTPFHKITFIGILHINQISKQAILFVIKKGSHGISLELEGCIRKQQSLASKWPGINFRVQRMTVFPFS